MLLPTSFLLHFFFFLMIRPPPRSTLFPYPTLFRSNPVAGAEASLGGKPIGKTDAAGTVKYQAPDKEGVLEVKREGFLPATATAKAPARRAGQDRKSTRLNSSHTVISYAVFCLKQKT